MEKVGCYRGLADSPAAPVGRRGRIARAILGLVVIAGAGVLYVWPVALLDSLGVPGLILWPLAVLSLWLGVSHLVAAATGYRGCPEIGAIPSLLLRRQVVTECKPWTRIDRRIGAV